MGKRISFKVGNRQIDIPKYYIIFGISVLVMIYIIYLLIENLLVFYSLNKKAEEQTKNLERLSIYINRKNLGEFNLENIDDLINKYYATLEEKNKIEQKFKSYQAAYNNFLKYIYLPSLNIWKDPYTNEIDVSLVGQKFIKENPFIDTNLIFRWSSFLKNVGFSSTKFPPNQIRSLKIGDIKIDEKSNTFSIPITVELITQNRKTFIGLVNKLSLTANKRNIALINQFFYTLFNEIKKQNPDLDDKDIGKVFYYWIKKSTSNSLLTKEVLDNTIKDIVGCSNLDEECYYNFRQKYISIPFIAYNIGVSDDVVPFNAKKEFLREFLKDFPPLIEIKKFVFTKGSNQDLENISSEQYIVQIDFDVFGRNITKPEVDQIAKVLAEECFGTGDTAPKKLTFDQAYQIVKRVLIVSSQKGDIDANTMYNLRQVLNYLEEFKKNEKKYNNYEKAIKLFETYRILKVNGFCKTQ